MKNLKICLFTDLHLAEKGQSSQGVDTRNNFKSVLEAVKEESPDHVIVAGDVSYREPSKDVYVFVKDEMDKFGVPYSFIAGNHDDSSWLQKSIHPELDFQNGENEFYYVKYIKDRKFIFLDTAIGRMSDDQFDFLDSHLIEGSTIIMHHPPVYAGVPHMDIRYSFQDSNRFQELIEGKNFITNIFCGHYHVERVIISNKMNVFITPSLFVQIDDKFEEFVADHYKIGYRNIIFSEESMITDVNYLWDKQSIID
jgi:Icc protein